MSAGILDTYRVKVASVFRSATGESVFNGTMEHARIVTEEAFHSANQSVRVLMNRAPSRQFDCEEVVSAVREFLDKPGAELKILFERDFDPTVSEFARCALKAPAENVAVRKVPEDWQSRYPYNFLTVDRHAFRFQDDRSTPVAIVAAGQKHAVATVNLDNIFDQLWDLSVPVESGPHETPEG